MGYKNSVEAKICTREQLTKLVAEWKGAGKKVVFTNGCFDILHLGHVDYLNQAADLGDKLVVALNTDRSVAALKGPHRPLQDENARLHIMASLACVDAVTLFDEPTPLELIGLLLPNCLVKGADYNIDTIVGAKEVLAAGGTVETVPLVEGYSTSAIEARIRKQS